MGKVGKLRHYVNLQSLGTTTDAYNNDEESYTTSASMYAKIEASSGKEFEIASQINSSISYTITVREMAGITDDLKATDRFQDASTGKIFNVIQALPFFETPNTYTKVLCTLDANPEAL